MDLKLIRTSYQSCGIFGVLQDENGIQIAVTLEHAYAGPVSFSPKIPPGVYVCQRGTHQLEPTASHPNPQPFQTFEITGVAGHSKLLFHVGNKNADSSGCVLLGQAIEEDFITKSGDTFAAFMELQQGVIQFALTVT